MRYFYPIKIYLNITALVVISRFYPTVRAAAHVWSFLLLLSRKIMHAIYVSRCVFPVRWHIRPQWTFVCLRWVWVPMVRFPGYNTTTPRVDNWQFRSYLNADIAGWWVGYRCESNSAVEITRNMEQQISVGWHGVHLQPPQTSFPFLHRSHQILGLTLCSRIDSNNSAPTTLLRAYLRTYTWILLAPTDGHDR